MINKWMINGQEYHYGVPWETMQEQMKLEREASTHGKYLKAIRVDMNKSIKDNLFPRIILKDNEGYYYFSPIKIEQLNSLICYFTAIYGEQDWNPSRNKVKEYAWYIENETGVKVKTVATEYAKHLKLRRKQLWRKVFIFPALFLAHYKIIWKYNKRPSGIINAFRLSIRIFDKV